MGCPSSVDGCRPRELVGQADQALYEAKAAGRNRVVAAPLPSGPTLLVDVTDDRVASLSERTADIT